MSIENSDEPEVEKRNSEHENATLGESSSDNTSIDSTSPHESSTINEENVTVESSEDNESNSTSIEQMLLEFDEQDRLIRDRSLLDPTHVVEEDRIVGRDEQLQEVTKMLRVALGDNKPPKPLSLWTFWDRKIAHHESGLSQY